MLVGHRVCCSVGAIDWCVVGRSYLVEMVLVLASYASFDIGTDSPS